MLVGDEGGTKFDTQQHIVTVLTNKNQVIVGSPTEPDELWTSVVFPTTYKFVWTDVFPFEIRINGMRIVSSIVEIEILKKTIGIATNW